MKVRAWSKPGLLVLLLSFASAVGAGGWGQSQQGLEKSGSPDSKSKVMVSEFCSSYVTSGDFNVAGATNGNYGTADAGDTFTFTATGNGTGSWRIVGDSTGDPTYVSGGTFPGTLTYVVPAGGLTAAGIGFYVDAYEGPGDSITGSCAGGPADAVPSLSFWGQVLVFVLIGSFGLVAFRRKRLV